MWGPRCYISLANGEERGAGLVLTPDTPSFKKLPSPTMRRRHVQVSAAASLSPEDLKQLQLSSGQKAAEPAVHLV